MGSERASAATPVQRESKRSDGTPTHLNRETVHLNSSFERTGSKTDLQIILRPDVNTTAHRPWRLRAG